MKMQQALSTEDQMLKDLNDENRQEELLITEESPSLRNGRVKKMHILCNQAPTLET